MLNAGDAGIASRTALSLEIIMAIVVVLGREFGFTVSKIKTILCMCLEGYEEVRFNANATGQI